MWTLKPSLFLLYTVRVCISTNVNTNYSSVFDNVFAFILPTREIVKIKLLREHNFFVDFPIINLQHCSSRIKCFFFSATSTLNTSTQQLIIIRRGKRISCAFYGKNVFHIVFHRAALFSCDNTLTSITRSITSNSMTYDIHNIGLFEHEMKYCKSWYV